MAELVTHNKFTTDSAGAVVGKIYKERYEFAD